MTLVIAMFLPISVQAQTAVLPLNTSNQLIPLLNSSVQSPSKATGHQEFLNNLKTLRTGSLQAQEQAAKALINNAPQQSNTKAIVSLLVAGRFYAGQNSKGKSTRTVNKVYRKHLVLAAKKTSKRSDSDKEAIFKFILGTFRAAEPEASWTKAPIDRKSFKDLTKYQAYVERQALELWNQGNKGKAISLYRWISKNLTGKAQRALTDRRYAYLSQKQYYADSNTTTHERRLRSLLQEYKNKNLLGENNTKLLSKNKASIISYYERLQKKELTKSLKKDASRKQQLQTIGLTKRLLWHLKEVPVKTRYYQEKLAKLYEANSQHSKAVSTYVMLAQDSSNKKQISYLNSAIKNQSIVASWPAVIKWNAQSKTKKTQRLALQNLHERRAKLTSTEQKWRHVAQIGLIDINIGRGKQAFTKWESLLNTENPTKTAYQIAGYIAHTYQVQKQWVKLELIARLAKNKGIRLVFNNKRLATNDLLSLALIEGGHGFLKTKQYPEARKRFQEFTTSFPRHQRFDEGLYYLALAQKGEGLHRDSISSLISITTKRPSSKYVERASKKCSDWSESLALENEMIHCSKTYIKVSKNQPSVHQVRLTLANLYVGREIHGQASYQLKTLARDKKISKSKRISYALRALEIEERYGSSQSAFNAAKLAESIDPGNNDIKARALAVKSRYFFEAGNIKKLQASVAKTRNLNLSSKTVRESAAECRFYLALLMASKKRPEIYNLELKNPHSILEKEFVHYNSIKNKFQAVCEIGPSSYCAPAQINLAQFADDTLLRIDEIIIAEKLSKESVDKFNNRKNKIYQTIATDNQNFTQRSLETVKNNLTAPHWTLQILWENSTDWNFDRITGETSNGFIQFTPQLIISEQ